VLIFAAAGVVTVRNPVKAALFLVLARTFSPARFANPPARAAGHSNTREIGEQLYTVYVYSFKIAAFILLVAIVAAVRKADAVYQ